jgi:hypothetical protein
MFNIRFNQKQKIKEILESVLDVDVTTHYTTAHPAFPYVYIASAELIPNIAGSSFDTGSYLRVYNYNIVCVFNADEILDQTSTFEDLIDDIEDKIITIMQNHSTRSNNAMLWNDLTCGTFSAFVQNDEPQINQTLVFKTLPISIETQVPYNNT